MIYFARPNEISAADMQNASLRNLQILQKHVQKQISLQEEIRKNLLNEIESLQSTKNSLISLIRQSIQAQTTKQNGQESQVEGEFLKFAGNNSDINVKLIASPKSINKISPNKSALMNRSQMTQNKQRPKEKQVNYLTNMNEYRHKDLIQELKTLLKQLNSIIKANSSSKELANSSFLIQSNYKNSSVFLSERFKEASAQEQSFVEKHLLEMGELQKLPSSSSSDVSDEVLTGLMNNLQKEELKLVQNTWKSQNLQVKKMLKQSLQEKTIENMRLIYKEKKRVESIANVKEVKSNKDIIKFGYTDKMINLIQEKTGFKVKLS